MLPADVDERVVSDVCTQLSRSQPTLSNQFGSPRGQSEGNQHTKDWRSEGTHGTSHAQCSCPSQSTTAVPWTEA